MAPSAGASGLMRPNRKPPANRLFRGMAGSALATVETPRLVHPFIGRSLLEPIAVDRSLLRSSDSGIRVDVGALTRVKSRDALRAHRWREEQKKKNAQFAQEEAARKRSTRTEAERKQAEAEHKQRLDKLLESGQFPTNLVALRKKDGPRLFLKDAPHGKGLIVTG